MQNFLVCVCAQGQKYPLFCFVCVCAQGQKYPLGISLVCVCAQGHRPSACLARIPGQRCPVRICPPRASAKNVPQREGMPAYAGIGKRGYEENIPCSEHTGGIDLPPRYHRVPVCDQIKA